MIDFDAYLKKDLKDADCVKDSVAKYIYADAVSFSTVEEPTFRRGSSCRQEHSCCDPCLVLAMRRAPRQSSAVRGLTPWVVSTGWLLLPRWRMDIRKACVLAMRWVPTNSLCQTSR